MSKCFLALFIAIILPIYHAFAAGPISSELERVKGFENHQRFLRDYDRAREQGASEVSKSRLEWENQLQAAIPEQKAAKAREAKALTEESPEYFQDLKSKEAEQRKHEELANEYSVESKRQQRGYVNLLSEAREYGLDQQVERFDWKKRALYDAKGGGGGGSSGRSATSGFTRPSDFSTAPEGQDFSAPPPPPPTQSGFDGGSGPEFFEPDIPPPPPEGGFDSEEIPPPIFDEPEF